MRLIKLKIFSYILAVLLVLTCTTSAIASEYNTAGDLRESSIIEVGYDEQDTNIAISTDDTIESEPSPECSEFELATSAVTVPQTPKPLDDDIVGEDTDAEPEPAFIGITPLAAAGTLGSRSIGSTVNITVNSYPREFIVVQHGKPSSIYGDEWNGTTLLLMKDIYEKRSWHDVPSINDYENSETHKYLNNQFFNLIEADIRNAILTLKIPYRAGTGDSNVISSGASGLPSKVFLLSGCEVGYRPENLVGLVTDGSKLDYFEGGNATSADNKRIANYSGAAIRWWLRTPSGSGSILCVQPAGHPAMNGTVNLPAEGVRPALGLPGGVLVDANGNISVNIAPTAPSSIATPSSVSYNTAYTVSWGASASLNGTSVGYRLERQINGGAWTQIYQGTATSYSQMLTRDQADTVNYRVKAYSTSGLESAYTTGAARNVTNNTAPDAPVNLNPDVLLVNSWENGTIMYTWTGSTDADGDPVTYCIEKSVNSGSWAQIATMSATSYSYAISPEDNTVQIRVRAYDDREYGGYVTSAITSVIHDTTAPTISLVAAPDPSSGWTASDVIITAVMANALSPLDKLVAPAGLTPTGTIVLSGNTATQTFTAESVGIYTFAVYNKAGLSAVESIEVGNVDQEPPEIAYTISVPDGEFASGDVDIHFTLTDALSGLKRFVTPSGAVELSGNTANHTYTVTQNGAPTFTLLDNVFNSTSVNIIIDMIDRIKPTVSINAAINQWHNQSDTTLQITANDDYSGVAGIRLPDDSLHYGDGTGYTITENGIYTVTATDKARNVSDEVSFNYYWFDRTPPTITSLKFEETDAGLLARAFSLFSKDIVTNKQIKMMISYDDTPTSNEAESGVEWILYRVYDYESNPKDEWITTHISDPVPKIDYEVNGYVEVQVVDRAGNYSTLERYEILLDSSPPVITYTLSETSVTNQPIIVALKGVDEPNGSGFKGFVLPDGNVFVPQSEIEYTFTENGTRTFIGCDNAGNQASVTVTVSNIKSAPPVVEDIIIEKIGNKLLSSMFRLFGQGFNEQIKVTIVATDAGQMTIYYCVTSDADIPNDAIWHEAPGGIVYFDTEMTGVIHAKAVDIAGSWSNTMSRALFLDGTPPIFTITLSERENDFEPVVIKVLAEDNSAVAGISGIAWITLPNGELTEHDYIEYTVRENGVYVFKATDNAGNVAAETVEIDCIRPVLPSDWGNNAPVIDAVLHATGKHHIKNVDYDDILNLRYLDLSAKGLETLPDILGYGKNIIRLDLRGNELVQVPECVFGLENLEYLDISNNNLQSVDERIAELKNLNYFDVSLNYLIDYECPAIISDYRNVGNFTFSGRPEQYSVSFGAPAYGKEYVGNTVQINTLWEYGGKDINETLEQHRKALYMKYYSDYKSYRPIIYGYRVSIGELNTHTPDYARVNLPEAGVAKLSITLGSSGTQSMRTMKGSGLSAVSEDLEVIDIPTPSIHSIDVQRGAIIIDVGSVDENIKADLKVLVEVSDEQENILAKSESKVYDSKLCEVPVAIILQKGHIITAKLVNNEFSGEHAQDINQNDGGSASGGDGSVSGNGGSSVQTKYIMVEKVIENEIVLEAERIGEAIAIDGNSYWDNSTHELEVARNIDENQTIGEKNTDSGNIKENGRASTNAGCERIDDGMDDTDTVDIGGDIADLENETAGSSSPEYRVFTLFIAPIFVILLFLGLFLLKRKRNKR